MASLLFPDAGSRRADDSAGRPQAAKTATVYTSAAGGTLAEIYADNAGTRGALIASAQLTTDSYGFLPLFWGPDSAVDRLYISVNGGPVWPVDADYNARVDALAARVTAVEAGSGGGDAGVALAVHAADTTAVHGIADTGVLETVTGAQAKVTAHATATTAVHGIADTGVLETITGAQAKATAAGAAAQTAATASALQKVANLADLEDAAEARDNLSLGDAATKDVGTTIDTVTAGNDSRLSNARTPTAHAVSHTAGGTDPVTVTQAQVTGLTGALAVKADLVDGKVPSAQIPAIAISNFLGTAANEAAMLGLDGEPGDWAIRTDTSTAWIITGAAPDELSSWTELPGAGGGDVSSVNGQTGPVTLTAADVGAAPTGRTLTAGAGLTGGGDLSANRTFAVAYGATAGTAAQGNDSRLSDSRTPTAHAVSHAAGGSDPLTLAQSQVSGLTSALAGKVDSTRTLTAGAGLSGGGDLSANRTFAVAYGTTAGTAAEGNDTRVVGAAQKASNLADLASAGDARTNLGLGNVTNTSDADKPVSTAQQAALDLKAPLASPTFSGTVAGISKTMVGLGAVDNTADAAKPVSTATQTALNTKVSKGDLVVRVEDYAAGNANFLHTDGQWYTDSSHTTLATDDTAAIRALVTAGATNLWFGSKRYRIQWTQQQAFLTWTGVDGVTVSGNGAVLCDTTTYTVSPANPYTPVFLFDACSNVNVSGVAYMGPTLTSPATDHGYRGATYLRAANGSRNITVDAELTNCRYGVQSGSYPTAADGYNGGLDVKLVCSYVGYPMAHYLADDIRADIYATDVHRACYLAGVDGARVRIRFKNQWIANMVCLLTDSLTGSGTSRGCTNIDAEVVDLGSTRTELTCVLAGIALQRVDPNTTFADIRLRVYAKATNTVANNVSAFQVVSGVKTLFPETYPLNWIPTIYLRNITLSGLLDKSAQTTSQSTGNIYIQTNDGTSYATVSNLRLDGLTILPSAGETSFDYLYIQGLVDRATIADCVMNNYSFTIIGNTTYPVVVQNSTLGNVVAQTKTHYVNATVRSLSDASWANATTLNSDYNGAAVRIRSKQVELTLTGASVTWASAILANVIVLGVSGVITQTITGSTGVQVGVAGDIARYLNTNSTAAGTTFTPANQAVTETTIRWSGGASTSIVATAKTANFTGGRIKIFLSYIDFTAPVS